MSFIKRHKRAAILSVCIGVLLLAIGIVIFCTKGELYTQDDLVLNDRVYIENIYVEEGVLYYTVVNKTPFFSLMMEFTDKIYTPIDGEWLPPSYKHEEPPNTDYYKGNTYIFYGERDRFPPFSKTEMQCKLNDAALEEGVYRIVIKDNYYGGARKGNYPLRPYAIVGYYTIP